MPNPVLNSLSLLCNVHIFFQCSLASFGVRDVSGLGTNLEETLFFYLGGF